MRLDEECKSLANKLDSHIATAIALRDQLRAAGNEPPLPFEDERHNQLFEDLATLKRGLLDRFPNGRLKEMIVNTALFEDLAYHAGRIDDDDDNRQADVGEAEQLIKEYEGYRETAIAEEKEK
jgi:hypothetical protein